jgi:parallel beta-helix repeat protein
LLIQRANQEVYQSLKSWIGKGRRPIWTAILIGTILGISIFTFVRSQGVTSGPQTGSTSLLAHAPILIVGNSRFLPFNGVTAGTGTASDPYIIQGWDILTDAGPGVVVRNTTAYFVVRNDFVHGTSNTYGYGSNNDGIDFQNVTNAHVMNVTDSGNRNAMSISSSKSILISGNIFSKSGAISLDHSSNVNISGNNISIGTNCIYPNVSSTGIVVSNNKITNCVNAVTIDNDSSKISITSNTVVNCTVALHVFSGKSITFSNNNVTNSGIWGVGSNSIIAHNHISSDFFGISILGSNTTFSDNDVSNNPQGVFLNGLNNTMVRNTFTDGGLDLQGGFNTDTITPDNLFGGKPVYYYKNCAGLNVDGTQLPWVNGVASLILANCKDVRVSNLQIGRSIIALQLYFITNANVSANTFFQNQFYGILLTDSNNVAFSGNSISSNNYGGLGIFHANNTLVYHNNFLNNLHQTDKLNGIGWSWDNGYPSGGNYWSDYSGVDKCSGPAQNICTGPDGIGDIAYVIDLTNQDHYPLMAPVHVSSSLILWPSSSTLRVVNLGSTSLSIEWTPPSTNTQIVGYRIYQGNVLLATVAMATTRFDVSGLTPGEKYTFRVEASDASGGWSTTGPSVTVVTQPASSLFPSLFPQYWYLPVGGTIAIAALAFVLRRISKRDKGRSSEARPLDES